MTTSVIRDEDDFYRLGDSWDLLLSRFPNPSIFLTFEWLSTWWKHFKEGRELFVVVTEQDGKIEGIAPLAIEHGRLGRRLHFLGRPGSDYSDFITSKDSESCLDSLLNPVLSRQAWDTTVLDGITGDSPNFKRLAAIWESMAPKGQYRTDGPAPYLTLGERWDDYQKGLSKKLITDTRRRLRRLRDIGEVNFKRCSDSDEVAGLMDQMVSLKRARYRATGARDIFRDERRGEFYQEVALKLLERGWLDLSYLELNGTVMAIHFGFVHSNRFFHYMPSFRQEYAHFSPGRLLVDHQVRWAFEAGLEEFDFLMGADQYKYEWTDTFRTMYSFSLHGEGLRAKMLHQLQDRVLPALKSSSSARGLIRLWRKRNNLLRQYK